MINDLLTTYYEHTVTKDSKGEILHSFNRKKQRNANPQEMFPLLQAFNKVNISQYDHFLISDAQYKLLIQSDNQHVNVPTKQVLHNKYLIEYSKLDTVQRELSKVVFFALLKRYQNQKYILFDFDQFYRISGEQDALLKQDDFSIRESTSVVIPNQVKECMIGFYRSLEQAVFIRAQKKQHVVKRGREVASLPVMQITHFDNQACINMLSPKPESISSQVWNSVPFSIKLAWTDFTPALQVFIIHALQQQNKNDFDHLADKTQIFGEIGRVVATQFHAKIPVYIKGNEVTDGAPENLFDLEDILKLTPLSQKELAQLDKGVQDNIDTKTAVYRHPYSRKIFTLKDVLPHPETLADYNKKLGQPSSSSSSSFPQNVPIISATLFARQPTFSQIPLNNQHLENKELDAIKAAIESYISDRSTIGTLHARYKIALMKAFEQKLDENITKDDFKRLIEITRTLGHVITAGAKADTLIVPVKNDAEIITVCKNIINQAVAGWPYELIFTAQINVNPIKAIFNTIYQNIKLLLGGTAKRSEQHGGLNNLLFDFEKDFIQTRSNSSQLHPS